MGDSKLLKGKTKRKCLNFIPLALKPTYFSESPIFYASRNSEP